MIAENICKIYYQLRKMGLIQSKREFSRHWLRKGKCYVRNLEYTGKLTVPPVVAETLRYRLLEVANLSPQTIACELGKIISTLERFGVERNREV